MQEQFQGGKGGSECVLPSTELDPMLGDPVNG